MTRYLLAAACLLTCMVLAACASSRITDRNEASARDPIPRPGRIIVYDLAATSDDVAASAAVTGYYDDWTTPQTAEEVELGRRLGAMVSERLVTRIVAMGMTAQRVADAPAPDLGDAVIIGQLFTIEAGSRGKRVVIGFGTGSAELNVRVNGYLVTETGLQLVGYRQVRTSGARFPGVALPIALSSPIGLAANSAMKFRGERGAETLEAAAGRAAERIAEELREAFINNGWIE